MGIETAPPDVEESTEPPIRAYTQHDFQHHNHPRDVKDTIDIEKAVHSHGQASDEVTTRHSENDPSSTDNAHTIEPSRLSALLDVNFQYVSSCSVSR